jgi:1,4-dihydroxy-2-naphthoate octaprenyltransferase
MKYITPKHKAGMKNLLNSHLVYSFRLKDSTIKLLRIPFSFFLSPIYLFALALVPQINWFNAVLIFIILHFLIYPASNGYNSYMDRDTESIGGLEKPPPPSQQLYLTTIVLDVLGILLSLIVGWWFAAGIVSYIAFSKAYSYRGIRLKKFAYIAYLAVVIFQGGVTFLMVYYGSSALEQNPIPWQGMVICALLIGGFYPITQIYQHQQDFQDGVQTISYKLGYTGTFIFCAIVYFLAWSVMIYFFLTTHRENQLLLVSFFFLPIIVYFLKWFAMVQRDSRQANFRNTMVMNWLAATCTNTSFLILLMWR